MTLQLTAGAAPVAELGKMLGQTGVNLVEVKRRYDDERRNTADLDAAMRTITGTAHSMGVAVAE